MKLTTTELTGVLEQKPVLANEMEIKEVFGLLGLKVKEYHRAGLSAFQSYEVHHRRTYLVKVEVDDSPCLSLSNEYINFGEGCHGMSFGGVRTVKELLQSVILIAQKIDRDFNGTAYFNEEESEYTEAEYRELIETLNEKMFEEAS
jgi:hypothetical protein